MSIASYQKVPLDPSLYYIDPRLARLFKQSTGLHDDEHLKKHILKIQAEAYESFPYPCIRLFTFTQLAVTEYPLYHEMLKHGLYQSNALLIDVGCGFGNDLRKLVADGFPAHKVVATDVNSHLWQIGHRLFCSNTRTFPVKFVQADVFDDRALSLQTPVFPARPDLRAVHTLTQLKGHGTIVTLQMVFHLFDQRTQYELAHRMATLLSPMPGSIMVGRQMGDTTPRNLMLGQKPHFLHNVQSWERMWATIFPPGTVELQTALVELPTHIKGGSTGMLGITHFLTWSIKRL
ncbi:hypothetical protein M422DRAFT_198577 [Sphaerobolus stellatus SS14]|nr:hypothetical protein M422DRAFT_198577 [Sphaerobolus stellatus SS14]